MLDRVRSLDRLLVLNDEAHHVHDEELNWNQTLVSLHETLPHGLSAWLDFSATPRFQGGAHFPWIVCDYPLAQAVEDCIVKAPMILHLVDKAGAREGHRQPTSSKSTVTGSSLASSASKSTRGRSRTSPTRSR